MVLNAAQASPDCVVLVSNTCLCSYAERSHKQIMELNPGSIERLRSYSFHGLGIKVKPHATSYFAEACQLEQYQKKVCLPLPGSTC